MSGRLVSAVFASALPAWLKPYAAAYATFAADDGSRVFPGVQKIARMVGRSRRQVYTATAVLRAPGILQIENPHGPHRPTRYRFVESALPLDSDGEQLPLFGRKLRDPQAQPAKPSMNTRFPQFAQAYTGSGLQAKGEVGFTRSVSDPSVSPRTRARTHAGK
jgi:hypothetical protein